MSGGDTTRAPPWMCGTPQLSTEPDSDLSPVDPVAAPCAISRQATLSMASPWRHRRRAAPSGALNRSSEDTTMTPTTFSDNLQARSRPDRWLLRRESRSCPRPRSRRRDKRPDPCDESVRRVPTSATQRLVHDRDLGHRTASSRLAIPLQPGRRRSSGSARQRRRPRCPRQQPGGRQVHSRPWDRSRTVHVPRRVRTIHRFRGAIDVTCPTDDCSSRTGPTSSIQTTDDFGCTAQSALGRARGRDDVHPQPRRRPTLEAELVGPLRQQEPVARRQVGRREAIPDLVVHEIDLAARPVLPAHQDIRRQLLVEVVPLDVRLHEQVGRERVQDAVAERRRVEGARRGDRPCCACR